jgi:hypothetical protein
MSSSIDRNGLHPREIADIDNSGCQEIIGILHAEIAVREMQLEMAMQEGISHNDIAVIRSELIDELDTFWPYQSDAFYVSGTWRRPQIQPPEDVNPDADDGSLTWQYVTEDVSGRYSSLGFGWREKDGRKRIGFTFAESDDDIQNSYVTLNTYLTAIALPEEVSLTLIPSFTEHQVDMHRSRVQRKIELMHLQAKLYMGRPEFYTSTHRRQQQLLEVLVGETNDQILAPGMELSIAANSRVAYMRTETSSAYGYRIFRPELPKEHRSASANVCGRLLGATLLERSVVDMYKIAEAGENVNGVTGLCLLVERSMYTSGTHQILLPVESIDQKSLRIDIVTTNEVL